jgi:hypothetical protein
MYEVSTNAVTAMSTRNLTDPRYAISPEYGYRGDIQARMKCKVGPRISYVAARATSYECFTSAQMITNYKYHITVNQCIVNIPKTTDLVVPQVGPRTTRDKAKSSCLTSDLDIL